MFHGIRAAGTATTPRSFGGVATFITNNTVDAGGAIMISDLEFNAEYVRDQILPVISNSTKLNEMSKASSSLGHKDSAADLAKLVLSVVGKAKS